MEEEDERTIREISMPKPRRSGIRIQPHVREYGFDLTLISALPKFEGREGENECKFLYAFEFMVEQFPTKGLTDGKLKFWFFIKTLEGAAKRWIDSIKEEFSEWDELRSLFLKRFLGLARVMREGRMIFTLTQKPKESFHDAWERFEEMQYNCPQHQFTSRQLCEYFYLGVREEFRDLIDLALKGSFMGSSARQVLEACASVADN